MIPLGQAQPHPLGGRSKAPGSQTWVWSTPCLPAQSTLLGELISQTVFPRGEQLTEGGREVLCELLKSETRKEVSRHLKQDKLMIVLWPKGSCGLAGL